MMTVSDGKPCIGQLHKSRVLFFLPEGNVFTNGVYASQCLGLARYLVKSGLAECAILQLGVRDENRPVGGAFRRKFCRLMRLIHDAVSRKSFIEKRVLEEGIVLYEDTKTRRRLSIFRKIGFFIKVSKRVVPFVKEFEPTHIYCRSYQTAFGASYLSKKLNAKMVYSIRGEDVSEKRCGGGFYNYLVSFWVRRAVMQAIRRADHINTVSKTFRSWLKNEYGCEASVTPCCVADRMFNVGDSGKMVRQELGFSDSNKILIYCGGMWPWLCVDEMVMMMKNLCETHTNIRVLFIVKNEQSVRSICARAGFSQDFWRVHGCKPEEVSQYMRLGDVGIILLRGDVRDRVCSPIKVGEYLAAGLGVIAPECTGDFSRDAQDKSFYCKYDGCEKVNLYASFISGITESDRVEARKFARGNYTWDANQPEIKKMFS